MTLGVDPPAPPAGQLARRSLILLIVCLAQFVVLAQQMIVFVTLPSIQRTLHIDGNNLSWVVNSYTLIFAGFLLLGGRSADLFGRKRLFIVGLAVFLVSSLLCALPVSKAALFALRALQGLGAAFFSPAALSILTTTFPESHARQDALAKWSASNAGSAAIGVLLGGVLTAVLSWRFVFTITGAMGVLILAVAVRYIPESRDSNASRIDIGGAVTVTGGLVALVYAVLDGSHHGWNRPVTVAVGGLAIVLLAAFVVIQRTGHSPLIRFSMFRLRTLTIANLTMFLVAGAPPVVLYVLTLSLQSTLDHSALKTAFALLPASGMVAIGSLAAPWLLRRMNSRMVLLIGLVMVAAGVGYLARTGPAGDYVNSVLPAIVSIFLGSSCATVTLFMFATTRVPNADAGVASGLITTASQIGSGLWLAVFSSVTVLYASVDADNYATALWGVAVLALFGAVLVISSLRHGAVANDGGTIP